MKKCWDRRSPEEFSSVVLVCCYIDNEGGDMFGGKWKYMMAIAKSFMAAFM